MLPTGTADAARCVKWATVTITTAYGDKRRKTVCQHWDGGDGDGDDGSGGGAAPGGGSGGHTQCTSTPRGDLNEVRRVWESVNAAAKPDPADPTFTDDAVHGDHPDRVVERSWYRINGDHIQVLYAVSCPGQPVVERWVTVTPTATGGVEPRVTPPDLIPLAWARAQRQLPTPVPRIAPADLAPDGFAFVQDEDLLLGRSGRRAVGQRLGDGIAGRAVVDGDRGAGVAGGDHR